MAHVLGRGTMATDPVSIRVASEEDLDQILSRLEVEHDDEESVAGGFWANRNLIRGLQEDGGMTVAVVGNNTISGFLLWNPRGSTAGGPSIDILVVWDEHRRSGIGRLLVETALAGAQDVSDVEVECTPRSSVQFWTALRFQTKSNTGGLMPRIKMTRAL